MITQAFIHEYGMGRLEPEHQDVKNVLEARGVPVQLFTSKLLNRRRLELSPDRLVVGNHPVMAQAFKYMGLTDLPTDSYPEVIQHFLKRKFGTTTLGSVLNLVYDRALTSPVFVKPKSASKKFTGCVLRSPDNIYQLGGASRQTIVYYSEVVNFISEYRVFVLKGKVIGIKNYEGDVSIQADQEVIQECINTLENSSYKTAAYGIDFGVLDTGETALIEWNDGYALGSYGLAPELYADFLIARWEELMDSPTR